MNAHTLTIAQQARNLPWSELVTLARANIALAPIYIGVIRDMAKQLYDEDKRRGGNGDYALFDIRCAADLVLEALDGQDVDLSAAYEDLDRALLSDDDDEEPEGFCGSYTDYRYKSRRDEEAA